MNIIQAMADPKLFAPWFKEPATWAAWRAFLAVLFHLPMDDAQIAIARACTGLETLPEQAFTEAWLVVGRRGGKSLVLAMIAIYLALFKDWSGQPGAWRTRHRADMLQEAAHELMAGDAVGPPSVRFTVLVTNDNALVVDVSAG